MDDCNNYFNTEFDDCNSYLEPQEEKVEIYVEDCVEDSKEDVFSSSPQDYEDVKLANSWSISELDESINNSCEIQFIHSPINFEAPSESTMHDNINETNNAERKNSDIKEKAKIVNKFSFRTPEGSFCSMCSKMVYPMEKIMMDSKCYHKTCFKCCKCGKLLNPTVATKMNDALFCKPHYIELFRMRGRYDDINANFHETDGSSSSYSTKRNDEISKYTTKSPYSTKQDDFYSRGPSHRDDDFDNQTRDTEPTNRVANATKVWARRGDLSSTDGKNNNNNQPREQKRVNVGSKVKSLMSLFESNK